MKQSVMKKLTSIAMILAMVLSMAPQSVFASTVPGDSHGVDAEWYNFRNNQENNGVTDRPTPSDANETALKWAEKYGTGWSAAPTPPLILGGYLYVGMSNVVVKIDKETGEEVDRSDPMVANVGFAMNPILYADGKIFVQVGNGMIQALDYKTLDCVWHTEKIGGQTVSPISYAEVDGKGYIYLGTWNQESRDGEFFGVTTDDSKVTDGVKQLDWVFRPSGEKKESDNPKWNFTYDEELYNTLTEENNVAHRGFYWMGAYATKNYVAVGSDDGTAEGDPTANAVFYTLNPATGEIIDRIDGIKGDIRTSVVYDNGYLYFSTKGGQLHKVSVDETGRLGEDSYIDLNGDTTAAPLVYKNKIYLGLKGPGGQFDPDGGHKFVVVDNSTPALSQDSLMYDLPIAGYPQAAALLSTANENVDYDGDGKADGRIYIYFTYNAKPGGIYYTYDTPDGKKAADEQRELFIPESEDQNYCISTICADRDGTLYYKNDSCKLFAVEANKAYIKDIAVKDDGGQNAIWNKGFDTRISTYTVKVSAEAKSAEITLDLPKDIKAEVNGSTVKNNKAKVNLNGEATQAKVTVTHKDGDSRTYTLTIKKASASTSLSQLYVNNSNTAMGGTVVEVSPALDPAVTEYTADITDVSGVGSRGFYNVWAKAAAEGTKIKVVGTENVSQITENGERFAVYPETAGKTMKVRIEVTSESGDKTTNYNLTLLRKIPVESVTLNKTEATIEAGETLQLTATVKPDDATVKEVTWYTSAETVAEVDQNGLVTAKAAGTAEITAISNYDNSTLDKCVVTVTPQQVAIDKTNFPDETFRDYVGGTIDTDGNGKLSEEEIAAVTEIRISPESHGLVADLTGIEHFTNLETLVCTGQELTAVDLSKNTKLKTLDLSGNAKLVHIDLTGLAALEEVKIGNVSIDAAADDYDLDLSSVIDGYDSGKATVVTAGVNMDGAVVKEWQNTPTVEITYDTGAVVKGEKVQYTITVNITKSDKLIAAEAAAVAHVNELIEAIGAGKITLESKADIDAAQAAYDNLRDELKDRISGADRIAAAKAEYEKLVAQAEKEEADKLAAKGVSDKIDAIGQVTLKSEPAIAAAEAAYAGLSDDQKAYVKNAEKLTEARKAYETLVAEAEAAAKNFGDLVDAIGADITLESEAAIKAARAAYDALTDDQKDYIGTDKLVDKLAMLEEAEAEFAEVKEAADKAAAAEVDQKIAAIGKVTLESKDAIAAARAAYDALTDDQKAYVEHLNQLTAAEKEYAALAEKEETDKKAAADVKAKIDAIGKVTLSDKKAIAAARAAYNNLTDDQKTRISAETLNKLTDAEVQFAVLEKAAKEKVAPVIDKINAIGRVTLASKADIDAARAAYSALTEEEQAYVTNAEQLKAAEKAYGKLVAAAEKEEADKAAAEAVDKKIDAIGKVTLESKDAIEDALAAYHGLTDDQKQLVKGYDVLAEAIDAYNALAEAAAKENGGGVKTGDASNAALYLTLFVLAGGVALLVRRKEI